jgi:NAD(P)-dependent dehydrogenase (short-subunit alcohol dehydrogenase family)
VARQFPANIAALERSLPDRLDGVVNNAGVVVAGPLEAVPPAELRRQLDFNVVGQMAVAQATLPRLRASRAFARRSPGRSAPRCRPTRWRP